MEMGSGAHGQMSPRRSVDFCVDFTLGGGGGWFVVGLKEHKNFFLNEIVLTAEW